MNILVYCMLAVLVYQTRADEHKTLQEVEAKFERQLQELRHEMVSELERQQNEFEKEIEQLKAEKAPAIKPSRKSRSSSPPPSTHIYSVYGCNFDIMTLDCPGNRSLIVNSAHYAQFSGYCGASDCCNPHPTDDCAESLEEYHITDWTLLTASCNYNNNCTFENPGALVDTCTSPYNADYMIIYYECLPLGDVQRSGFTARDETGYDQTYERGEIIQFSSTLSNLGSNYQTQTSIFICPVDGMYSFSLTLHNDEDIYTDQNFEADIMLEGTNLITIFILYKEHHQSTGNVLVECKKGEQVWAQCNVDDGCKLRDVQRSGFTARDETGIDQSYNRYEIIQFSSTLSNLGSNYQTQTSIFICPVDGMYSFSLTLHNIEDTYAWQNFEADIKLEGINLVTLFLDYDEHQQSSVNALVECRKGERVWVECNVEYGCEMRNFDTYYYNSFSGFLIYAY